jgi:hypothetical protein
MSPASPYDSKQVEERIERVDKVLAGCRQRGLDPVRVLQKAIANFDKRGKRCDSANAAGK